MGSPRRASVSGQRISTASVEVHHSQEPLQGGAVSGWRKSRDGRDILVERSRPRAGDGMTKIFNLRGSENKLLLVDGEAKEGAEVKHTAEVQLMICQGT